MQLARFEVGKGDQVRQPSCPAQMHRFGNQRQEQVRVDAAQLHVARQQTQIRVAGNQELVWTSTNSPGYSTCGSWAAFFNRHWPPSAMKKVSGPLAVSGTARSPRPVTRGAMTARGRASATTSERGSLVGPTESTGLWPNKPPSEFTGSPANLFTASLKAAASQNPRLITHLQAARAEPLRDAAPIDEGRGASTTHVRSTPDLQCRTFECLAKNAKISGTPVVSTLP